MIALTHLIALLVFILLGGLGMAALQDGGTSVWKRMVSLFSSRPAANHKQASHAMLSPLTFGR